MSQALVVVMEERRYRRHRATSTVAAFTAFVIASLSIAFGFVVVPGTKHFGVSTAQFLLFYSIFILVSAISMSFVGSWIVRLGVRRLMTVSGVVGSASVLAMALAPNIYVIYLLAVPLGVAVAGSTLLPANTLATGWHTHPRRGTVLGIAAVGTGLGAMTWGLVFPPIIQTWGFQGGVITIGGIFCLFGILPGFLLAKNPPAGRVIFTDGTAPIDVNVRECNDPAITDAAPNEIRRPAEDEEAGMTEADRGGSRAGLAGYGLVAFLLAMAALLCAPEGAFNSVQPAVYESVGLDATLAGYALSFNALCGILAKPALGFMHDRLGTRALFVMLTILFIAGLPLMGLVLQAGYVQLRLLFPILAVTALSMAVTTVILPLIVVEAAGRQRFPAIYGVVLTGYFCGLAISVPGWGLVFDISGAYFIAMYGSCVVGLIGLGLLYLGLQRGHRRTRLQSADDSTAPADTSAEADGPASLARS